jgi:hypothetical protein
MERNEAIARLKRHEAELKRLGVNTCTCSARQRATRRQRIPTSISSSITNGASWGFSG